MNNKEILNKMHLLHLILADELKRICEKYNLKYFMIAGTLLGAVRHNGFIPWDDDMDFGMLRSDYDKFIEICKTELDSDRFYLQTDATDKYYTFNFAKIRLNGTKVVEEFSQKVNTNQGIYIDIFPIDNVFDNKIKAFIQYKSFWLFRNLLWIKCGYGGEERKKQISYKVAHILSSCFSINFLKRMKRKTITMCHDNNVKYVVTSDGAYGLKKETLKKEWLMNLKNYKFENRSYPSIQKSDEYLQYFYGNYMELPPIEKRNHHVRLKVDFGKYNN